MHRQFERDGYLPGHLRHASWGSAPTGSSGLRQHWRVHRGVWLPRRNEEELRKLPGICYASIASGLQARIVAVKAGERGLFVTMLDLQIGFRA